LRLDQFEKLKQLVSRLIEQNREQRFALARLQKENERLKAQLEKFSNLPDTIDDSYLNDLLTENERLKDKTQTVRTTLGTIISNLEQRLVRQNPGVDH